MRPLKLTLQAFGSYLDKTEVDFSLFNSNDIFLVTGDTGSGKTTIFDGMTFALYGETSAGSGAGKTGRKGFMLRSDFADPKLETYAELEFESHGKLYKIYRSPAYEREGYKSEKPAEVEWYEDGVKTELKKADVATRVKEVVGLDMGQFRHIGLLAQGDFRKMLVASTDDRSEIFKTIFDTAIYANVQNRVKEDAKAAKESFEHLRGRMNDVIDSVEGLGLSGEHDNLYTQAEAALDALQSMNLTDQQTFDANNKEVTNLNNTLMEAKNADSKVLSAHADFNNKYTEYTNHVKHLKDLKENFVKVEEAYKEWQAKSTDKYVSNKTQIEEVLKRFGDIEKAEGAIAFATTKVKKANESVERLGGQKTKLEMEKGKLEAQVEAFKNVDVDIAKCDAELNAISQKKASLSKLFASAKDVAAKEADLKKVGEKGNSLARQCREAEALYSEKELIRRSQVFGSIAADLEEDMPCPVCGSVHHPNPAKVVDETVTEEVVNSLKEKVDVLSIKVNTMLTEYKANKANLEKDRSRLEEDIKAEYEELELVLRSEDSYEVQVATLVDIYAKRDKSATTTRNDLLGKKKLHESQLDRIKAIDKELKSNEVSLEKAKGELATLEQEKASHEATLKALRNNFNHNKADMEENLKKVNQTIHAINSNKELTAKKYQETKEEMAKLHGTIETEEAEVLKVAGAICGQDFDKASEDVKLKVNEISNENHAKQQEIIGATSAKFKAVSDARDIVHARLAKNKDAEEKLRQLNSKFIPVWAEHNRLEDLKNAFLGSYKLETYMQALYFDKIITSANIRLMKMMNGNLELERGNVTQGNSGLDLFVYDYRTCKKRDVKSLSGGESFVASLAMALGLSDVVSAFSGGVRLDTLFVDEGFGSLDDTTLDLAMDVLSDISGKDKLVGIISHVDALKTRIDNQILVEKDSAGHSHVTVVTA